MALPDQYLPDGSVVKWSTATVKFIPFQAPLCGGTIKITLRGGR